MPTLMVSHDEKNHVAPHFNCLDLRNAMVPLTTLLASCDTTTGGNGVTDQKSHVAPHLDYINLRSAVVPLMTPLASCDTDANSSSTT